MSTFDDFMIAEAVNKDAEINKLKEQRSVLLAACKRAKKLLEPEVTKEPDRTIFWELVDAINKAEAK